MNYEVVEDEKTGTSETFFDLPKGTKFTAGPDVVVLTEDARVKTAGAKTYDAAVELIAVLNPDAELSKYNYTETREVAGEDVEYQISYAAHGRKSEHVVEPEEEEPVTAPLPAVTTPASGDTHTDGTPKKTFTEAQAKEQAES